MSTLFQKALQKEVLATPPVWMMRQAGRYHSHYQGMKQKHSFMELCKEPELAAEVAMGPIRDFDFDVAILFSDLLFPLEVLGMPLTYNPGPQLGWKLETEAQLRTLKKPEEAIKGLSFQGEAVAKTRAVLPQDKSLIGFVGGPWTLFVYAVEGSHKGELQASTSRTELYKKFAELMVPLLKKNIELQLQAGAEVVMIFDTAAGEVDADFFQKYLAADLRELARPQMGYYLKKGSAGHFQALAGSAFAGFGYDAHFAMAEILKARPAGFSQGNFDQSHLTLARGDFEKKFEEWVAPLAALSPAERAGWVAGLAHGITPQAKEENVRAFVQNIRKVFR